MAEPTDLRQLLLKATVELRGMRSELEALKAAQHEPIAIVGMGCRFPKSPDLDAFWRLLEGGVDGVTEIPPSRFAWDPELPATRWAGLIDQVDTFDAAFFEISPREATSLDPQQRLVLEVVHEAIEDSGRPADALMGTNTGVFFGVSSHDYQDAMVAGGAAYDAYAMTGNTNCFIAGRVAYVLGLQGPCYIVDTACSSSLHAIHVACDSLRARQSDRAIAGGVNLILSSTVSRTLAAARALSPDGRCKTFDAAANGFVRAEGCGAIVLRRLSDALRDGDRVRAVIRGSAINQDGRSSGITAPNVRSQEEMLRAALDSARLAPERVGYVEAHGTGTPLGDPIELEALKAVFGRPRADGSSCALGSVKTNFGHVEAGAGVAGVIKTVLALEHETIPPHLHFETLNPRISLEGTPFVIPTAPRPWPRAASPRVAGVSGFGLSGSNAHVILEEAPPRSADRAPASDLHQLPLSARSPAALSTLASRFAAHLAARDDALEDVCRTAALGRAHHKDRLSIVAAKREEIVAALNAAAAGKAAPGLRVAHRPANVRPKVVFVFSGHGSQWLGMGRTLFEREPVFRASIEALDAAMRRWTQDWTLIEQLFAGEATSKLARNDVVQPALFALGVALAALWRAHGVEPDCVIGHSMGEVAAACVAGALSLDDAARVICLRSRLLAKVVGRGGMMMAELSAGDARAAIAGHEGVSIAVHQSPRAVVLSGDKQGLESIAATLEKRGVYTRWVRVDYASHSPQMDPLERDLLEAFAGLAPRAGTIPIHSTLLGRAIDGAECDAAYWVRNLREPVLFAPGVAELARTGHALFLEMSPHPLLLPSISECAAAEKHAVTVLPSQVRDEDQRRVFLDALGGAWAAGAPIDFARLHPGTRTPIALPTYPWQRERFWPDGEGAAPAPRATTLLGAPVASSLDPSTTLFERDLGVDLFPLLAEHAVRGAVVLPAAAIADMALGAAQASLQGGSFALESIALAQPLAFEEKAARKVQLALTEESPGAARWRLSSRGAGETAWTLHAAGSARAVEGGAPEMDVAAVRERATSRRKHDELYAAFSAHGVEYGPTFRGIEEAWSGDGEALARVALPAGAPLTPSAIHPAHLDAVLQVLGAAAAPGEETHVPARIARLRVFAPVPRELLVHATITSHGAGEVVAGVRACDPNGRVAIEVEGLALAAIGGASREARPGDRWLHALSWEPKPLETAAAAPGRLWLIPDAGGAAATLAKELAARGAEVSVHSGPATREAFEAALRAQPSLRGVVFLAALDAGEAHLSRDQERVLGGALALVQAVSRAALRDPPRVYLITRGAQPVSPGPVAVAQAPLWGWARSIAVERPELLLTRVDLDPAARTAEPLAAELLAGDPEEQVALRGAERLVARIVPSTIDESPQLAPAGGRPHRLEIDRPGVLDRLALRELTRRAPAGDEVEIEVAAASINFVDLMKALGIYPGLEGQPVTLGGECAGRVVRLGAGVRGLELGQEVVALGQSCAATHLTTRAALVAPRPAALDLAQASCVASAYMTAWHALLDLGRLEAGERVLIHSAASGTGLAAVHLARRAGAEVFATAGSEERRETLRALGVRHVMGSRTLDFAAEVMRASGGRGVDVVLNSLSGPALDRSLSVLAPDGRFLELGKKDIYAGRALGMSAFKKRITVSAIDLGGLALERPERFVALFQRVMSAVRAGELPPLPADVFPAARAPEAFFRMARAQHQGRVVLSFGDPATPIARDRPAALFRADRSYLITGGLGGLGLALAEWMASRGAKHLHLLGRSAAPGAALARIEAAGCRAMASRVDVSDRDALAAFVRRAESEGPPIAGVFHLAAVIEDGLAEKATWESYARVLAPKLAGAWNLHQLLQDRALDCFVLYSSGAGLLGSPGQAGYAAASAFLDALAHHRRHLGLPALSIDWGAFSEVGLAAASETRGERLAARGSESIRPAQGHEVLERLLRSNAAQMGVIPLDVRRWLEFFPSAARSPTFARLLEKGAGERAVSDEAAAFRAALSAAPPSGRADLLEAFLREQLSKVLRLDAGRIDRLTPLATLGLDSLMGLELRNRLESGLGVSLSVTLLWTHPHVAGLAAALLAMIDGSKAAQPAGASGPAPAEPTEPAEPAQNDEARASELDAMSDDELAALLDEKVDA